MYLNGRGVEVDFAQALPWFKMAAAQDHPKAVTTIGTMYFNGRGVTPSWRRAQEHYKRAIKLGHSSAVTNMQSLTDSIPQVTTQ